MATYFRIRYKVLEDGKTYAGDAVGPESMEPTLARMRKRYPDATIIHAELIDKFEHVEPKVFSTSAESLIVLGMHDSLGEWWAEWLDDAMWRYLTQEIEV